MKSNPLIRASFLVLIVAFMLPAAASSQTLERIKSTGSFNIGFVSDQAPFSFKSTDNQTVGYAIELCGGIADKLKSGLGLPNMKVNYTPTTLEAGLTMIEGGKLDILCGPTSDTLKRREHVAFSLPIYITGTGALVRKDAPEDLVRVLMGRRAYSGPIWRGTVNRALTNRTFAVFGGTVTEEWVRKKIGTLGVIATVVTVDDHAKGVQMVLDGKADAYLTDRVILEHYASTQAKDSDKLMVVDRYFTYEPLALAIARNNDDFRLVVDSTLSELYRSGGIVEIFRKYFGEPTETALLLFKLVARD